MGIKNAMTFDCHRISISIENGRIADISGNRSHRVFEGKIK